MVTSQEPEQAAKSSPLPTADRRAASGHNRPEGADARQDRDEDRGPTEVGAPSSDSAIAPSKSGLD
jgi:hypothetical protein